MLGRVFRSQRPSHRYIKVFDPRFDAESTHFVNGKMSICTHAYDSAYMPMNTSLFELADQR